MDYTTKNSKLAIRKFFGKILKNSILLQRLYNTYLIIKNKKKYVSEVGIRKSLSVFEFLRLSEPLPFYPIEKVKDSNFYGQSFIIKRYCNLNHLSWSIEHGLMFGDYIPYSYLCKTTQAIITMSNIRAQIISKETNKPTLAVGPYINYANCLISKDDLILIKKDLGRVLLFFPSHSSVECDAINDVEMQIEKINAFAKNKFDTIVVCLFYLDIQKYDFYKRYQKAGYKIVTAGHRYDVYFLDRLKTIISLSDYTVSSSVGTHIGYCTFMNKPHWIIMDNDNEKMPEDYRLIYKTYREYSPSITEKQCHIAAKYWGFNEVKTITDLKLLIN